MKKLLHINFLCSLLWIAACATAPSQNVERMQSAVILPDEVSTVALSQFSKTNCADYAAKVKKEWKWKTAVQAASVCYKNKNFDAVEDLAKELSQKEPSYPWGPYYYALLAKDNHQWERASWMIELAYTRAPQVGAIQYLRGQVQWNAKNYKAAVESFEYAVSKDQGLAEARVLLGQIYFQDQEFDKALDHFTAAIRADSKNKNALYGYAECMIYKKNYEEAINTLNQLAEKDASDGKYLKRIAEIQEYEMHDAQAAEKTLKKIQKNLGGRSVAGEKGK